LVRSTLRSYSVTPELEILATSALAGW
jgi:hypothetical protein